MRTRTFGTPSTHARRAQIMLAPPSVIALLRARDIPEPQARLRPPHVVARAMDPVEHDRLTDVFHEELALLVVCP